MSISIHPLSPALGAEIRGIDLSEPLSDDNAEIVMRAFRGFSLLLFKNQTFSEQDQIRFSTLFGRPSRQGAVQKTASAITYVSNVRADGTFGVGELNFHADQYYFPHPMKAIMLYGVEVPERGGDTLFVNAMRAYDRLPTSLRERIANLQIRHHFDYGRLDYGDKKKDEIAQKGQVESLKVSAVHPVVSTHPVTGAPIIVVNQETTDCILGMTRAESDALIRDLSERITAPDNLYRHRWQPGDFVVWDNLGLQHARSNFANEQRRTLRRIAIAHDHEPMANA